MPLVRHEDFPILNKLRLVRPVVETELHGTHPACFIAQTEQQPHWQSFQTGFTAGKVDPGEALFDAAHRELREELGLEGVLTLVYMQAPAPGYDWLMYYFIATDLSRVGEQDLDPGERIMATTLLSADILKRARNRTLRASGGFVEQLLISGTVRNALELDAVLSEAILPQFDVEKVGYWWMK
jgi:8-oxo-dGTP pyrophosphatase MutT (NUDIX family)